jgi:hypothetical protein
MLLCWNRGIENVRARVREDEKKISNEPDEIMVSVSCFLDKNGCIA